jgi:hypothetical protein
MSQTIRSRDEARVVGGAALLFTSVAMGILLAYVARGFHGTLYIPLVTPCVLGAALGLVLARVCVRTRMNDAIPVVVAAALGGAILYGAYHVLIYGRVVDFMVSQMATFADAAASHPKREVMSYLESQTGERGFFAYLAFVSQGENGVLHPLGMLGALRPGLAGSMVAMLLEGLGLVTVAVWVTRRRSRAITPEEPSGAQVREVIAHTDAGTLRAAMEAMDRGDYEAAGRVLRRPDVDETFAVALVFNPDSAESYLLEILEGPHVCTSRQLSSWDGQALWDALRVK